MDYYEILGISRDASQKDIKTAFKKLAMKNHPDRGGDEEEFKKIQGAYDTLSNPEKRAQYDNPDPFRNIGGDPFAGRGNPFADIFGDMFGQQRRPQNFNAETSIGISLEDVYFGTTKRVDVGTGAIDIDIPKGVKDGTIYNVPGKAPQQDANLPAGDLRIRLITERHPSFGRDGRDLIGAIEIDYIGAILGTKVTIAHISGKQLQVSVPPNTNPDSRLKLRGEGFIQPHNGIVGDFLILVKVVPPKQLSEQHNKLLQQILQERKRNS
tara:strand:- start:12976 stop:13776 length:801 start_codon:yes stop_codon:yes gene_type:complete